MSRPIGLQVLRAKLRGFGDTGASITSRISKSEKERKHKLWNQKRLLGTHCRLHLVAYGLLRGIPYERIERCADNNQLNPQLVLEIMLAHNGWSKERGYVTYDLAKVTSLLTRTSSLEQTPQSTSTKETSPQSSSPPPEPAARGSRKLLQKSV